MGQNEGEGELCDLGLLTPDHLLSAPACGLELDTPPPLGFPAPPAGLGT